MILFHASAITFLMVCRYFAHQINIFAKENKNNSLYDK